MPPDDEGHDLPLEELAKGIYSAHADRRVYVIRDGEVFSDLWAKTFERHPLPTSQPSVDFSSDMVLAAYLGEKFTSGHRIEITGAKDLSDAIHVYLAEVRPGPSAIVAQVLTQPYHIVKTRRADKGVVFEEPEILLRE